MMINVPPSGHRPQLDVTNLRERLARIDPPEHRE